jgi:capsid portal protein
MFDDGEKLNYSNNSVDIDVDAGKYAYRSIIEVNDELLNYLKAKRVIKFKIDQKVYDVPEWFGNVFKEYVSCISKL